MTADTVGGVWTYALELSQALGKQGIQVALATMGAPLNREQCETVAEVSGLEVFESTFKLEWMQEPWKEIDLASTWLLELEESLQPDIVHLNGYCHAALPWHAPTVVVGHSCVLSWWLAVRGQPAPGMWATYRQRVTRGLRAAGAIIAPSKAMVATLNQHYGPVDVRVIPNGRDTSQFEPGDKEPMVLAIGRVWDEGKNIVALEHVAPELPWPVYVAGEREHPDGGGREPENVCYLGSLPVPTLAEWLGRASIYALPARYEPFGLSVLEAGLCGCALVLGDIPSLRENWDDAAIFVSPNDTQALQEAIECLIADDARREALGVCARARALQFTPERMAASYVTLYSDLMAANNLMIKN
ncbi:MAG: glycosyltransferase family 4 protein [Chloroflexi bacterium]|nr:glycosyltransferase family 4 protein [Chloroflexota bacterium]